MSKVKAPDPNAPRISLIDLVVSGVDFKLVKQLTKILKVLEGIQDVKRTFRNGVATFKVRYEGSSDDLAEAFHAATPEDLNLEVTGFTDRTVEMAVK